MKTHEIKMSVLVGVKGQYWLGCGDCGLLIFSLSGLCLVSATFPVFPVSASAVLEHSLDPIPSLWDPLCVRCSPFAILLLPVPIRRLLLAFQVLIQLGLGEKKETPSPVVSHPFLISARMYYWCKLFRIISHCECVLRAFVTTDLPQNYKVMCYYVGGQVA